MKSQIFVAIGVALVSSVLLTGLESQIYSQSSMTGGMAGVGNMTGGNLTGKINSFMPSNASGRPADTEGIERCPPPQEQINSNGETDGNGNGDASDDWNGDNSDDGNEGDSSNSNENDENQ
ncbi:MAG TPA: hypothetical protein VE548_07415 [Nitrososphaeraceae archaeon]|jgi:hypothetical protein|nr:hypothetical protein [Nitrososphaeraceae archaeon]